MLTASIEASVFICQLHYASIFHIFTISIKPTSFTQQKEGKYSNVYFKINARRFSRSSPPMSNHTQHTRELYTPVLCAARSGLHYIFLVHRGALFTPSFFPQKCINAPIRAYIPHSPVYIVRASLPSCSFLGGRLPPASTRVEIEKRKGSFPCTEWAAHFRLGSSLAALCLDYPVRSLPTFFYILELFMEMPGQMDRALFSREFQLFRLSCILYGGY